MVRVSALFREVSAVSFSLTISSLHALVSLDRVLV